MTDTLADARDDVMANLKSGGRCPCCGQHAQMYKRRVSRETADFLARLVALWLQEPRWYHTREVRPSGVKASTDASHLVHWGLLETTFADRLARLRGNYRPTEKGVAFVQKRILVPAYALIFDNNVLEWATEQVSIDDALKVPFNLKTILGDTTK
jgi:hypothetical protein